MSVAEWDKRGLKFAFVLFQETRRKKAKSDQDGEICRNDLVLGTQNWKSETLGSISSTTDMIFKF